MYITYNKYGYQIIKLNKDATQFVVYECLDCQNKIFIENGVDGYKCNKCNGVIDPIDTATRVI
jgi:ribosomal protein L37AE/L43A